MNGLTIQVPQLENSIFNELLRHLLTFSHSSTPEAIFRSPNMVRRLVDEKDGVIAVVDYEVKVIDFD
jgi:hypothetical protein